ncbi:hypothetical protein H8N03_19615 [Ramlibacter sp. USB13]|uniref:Uncharacterized protein n=1 Tax=Ramlibacter cellulosilyticus TaxID=2764187 RepID=A0A923MTK6_9BURK|nr:hypothetical protein [Ramlibacter cellulosilyticus]MBC5785165.1 hypothetical protein [Ramlibacter cellulosilyticus]
MNRWIPTATLAALVFAAGTASAQITSERGAPLGVKPAVMAVSATPPIIQVDGKDDRFSPGVRIRDRDNRLVLTGTLAGKTIYTVYKRDGMGLVHEVWLLNEEEFKKLGGTSLGDPEGIKRFNELLDLIWANRWLLLGR